MCDLKISRVARMAARSWAAILVFCSAASAQTPAPAARVVEAAGLRFQIELDRPGLEKLALKAVPSFRDRMTALAQAKDLKEIMARAEVKQEVIKNLKTLTGTEKPLPEISARYDALIKAVDHLAVESCIVKDVFLYDGPSLKARMRAGAAVPFMTYDRESDSCMFDWSVEKALKQGTVISMPIVIVVTNPAEPDDQLMNRMLGFYESIFTNALDANYALPGYQVIRGLVDDAVRERADGCPPWFKEGVTSVVLIKMLGELVGIKNAFSSFTLMHSANSGSAPIAGAALLKWNPGEHALVENMGYSRMATDSVLKITNAKGFKWIPFALTKLSKQENVSSTQVFDAVKELTGVDLSKVILGTS